MSEMSESNGSIGDPRAGSARGGNPYGNSAAGIDVFGSEMANPFKMPSDHLIFTFKDDEKKRKINDRENNKKKKIYEKNRPTREGCLRKLCDTKASELAIHPKVQGKINVAEAAAFNVPTERPKNRENRYQLIEKKREMFLVQQMLEIKDTEIERLANHNEMRQIGLLCSEKMLEADTKSFLDFFAEIKQQTTSANQKLEALKKKKNEETAKLRSINDNCSQIQSKINKNLEELSGYYEYKIFLDELAAPKDESKDTMSDAEQQAEQLKAEREREQRELQDKLAAEAERNRMGGRRGGPGQGDRGNKGPQTRAEIDALYDVQIPAKLRTVIDDPNENAEYPVPFSDPQQLMDIFQTLEERNLFLIQQGQNNEETLEFKSQEYQTTKIKYEMELGTLNSSVKDVELKTNKTISEKKTLEQQTQDGNNKFISDKAFQEISHKINDVSSKMIERGKSKFTKEDLLQNLLQIEQNIDQYIADYKYNCNVDESAVQNAAKRIRKDERTLKTQQENLHKSTVALELKKNIQFAKQNRVVPKGMRPIMRRTEKKKELKAQKKQEEHEQWQLDMLTYLGEIIEYDDKN